MRKARLGYGLLGLAFLLDRLFKMVSLAGISASWLQPALFNSKLVSGLLFNPTVSLIISLVILLVLIFCFSRYSIERPWLAWVIAGASSNVWDRLWYGGVIDYWTWAHWPWVFNLADLMIIGALLWYVIKNHLAQSKTIR